MREFWPALLMVGGMIVMIALGLIIAVHQAGML
jgi:L-asparagine transporter-like permease